MSTTFSPSDILRRAHAVGNYYGFSSLSSVAQKAKNGSRSPYPESLQLDTLDPVAKDVAGFLKHVRDTGLTPSAQQPLFLWHTNAAAGRQAPKQIVVQFHALGVDHSIADAVLIRAVRALVADLMKGEHTVRLNSMGDKETRARYARELTTYFRKQGATLPSDCVDCARTDVMRAAEMVCEGGPCEGFPSPTDHLSESSRKHFESVLEFLEETETPYELVPSLLSRGTTWTETCFELLSGEDKRIHAWGSRYAELAKEFFSAPVPSVGAVVRITLPARVEIPAMKERSPQARFVFVHIGDEAKRESMKVTDDLRRARIPMTQGLGLRSLTEQMRFVDEINPPYLLIMGRKEALERTVILRERANHTETFIPLDSLIDQLKAVA